ncbi:MAG: J domain-containing protein [Treponema sp.]|jgi:DnaJ-domain-containing protein 1|nr:J domain-containing protein [Treponema sp.]
MGIFDRLGDVLKSYINSEDRRIFGRLHEDPRYGDPDLEAAYEELDELLGTKQRPSDDRSGQWSAAGGGPAGQGRPEPGRRNTAGGKIPPEHLRADFAELGLAFGAPPEECKAAYKKLLKIHHPDRHAGHPGNLKKATAKSARINAAYDRIEKWRSG